MPHYTQYKRYPGCHSIHTPNESISFGTPLLAYSISAEFASFVLLNIPSIFLPHSLCMYCSLCLKCSSLWSSHYSCLCTDVISLEICPLTNSSKTAMYPICFLYMQSTDYIWHYNAFVCFLEKFPIFTISSTRAGFFFCPVHHCVLRT